jgi:FtsZ-binding cell division protein ZapB
MSSDSNSAIITLLTSISQTLNFFKSEIEMIRNERNLFETEKTKFKKEIESLKTENETLKKEMIQNERNLLKTEKKKLKKEIISFKFENETLKKEVDIFHQKQLIDFQFIEYDDTNDDLHGALYALNLESLVDMTASSVGNGCVQDLICAKQSLDYYTANQEDSWIKARIRQKSIIPTHYILRGRFGNDLDHLQSWILQGKTLKGDWINLHSAENQILPFKQIRSFPLNCEHQLCEFRLQNVGLNSSNRNHLCLGDFEIFGKVFH